jgi:hypothetical protein
LFHKLIYVIELVRDGKGDNRFNYSNWKEIKEINIGLLLEEPKVMKNILFQWNIKIKDSIEGTTPLSNNQQRESN